MLCPTVGLQCHGHFVLGFFNMSVQVMKLMGFCKISFKSTCHIMEFPIRLFFGNLIHRVRKGTDSEMFILSCTKIMTGPKIIVEFWSCAVPFYSRYKAFLGDCTLINNMSPRRRQGNGQRPVRLLVWAFRDCRLKLSHFTLVGCWSLVFEMRIIYIFKCVSIWLHSFCG